MHRVVLTLLLLVIQIIANVTLADAATIEPAATNASEKAFIDALMGQMTLDEKLGQMNQLSVGFDVTGPVVSNGAEQKIRKGLVGSVLNTYTPAAVRKLQQLAMTSRLRIPLLFGYDVIHGHRTIFPINLGLSCSWDTGLVERTARAAAEEATADGVNWAFAPMVDICRDPRWGRCSEGSGEDPYLGSAMARSTVQGFQGKTFTRPNSLLACVKHFALYGAAEAGRDYNTVDMSPVRMFNEYLPPYKAAIDAGAKTVMTSFNEINGVPATANRWLVSDLLRKQWDFKGFVVTDYTAIREMVAHGVGDEKKATQLAFNAGIDMDMVSEDFIKYGPALVREGKVSIDEINAACRRILEAKYELGLFSDPFRFVDETRAKQTMLTSEKLALAKESAEKCFVLLKNSNGVLPLKKEQKIAFIGPQVREIRDLIGSWSGAGDWNQSIGIWKALEAKGDVSKFTYARGCNLLEPGPLFSKLNSYGANITLDARSPQQMIQEATAAASGADVVVAVLGEPFIMSGEAASRSDIGLPGDQLQLLKALKKTGKPVVLVLMNGRPLTVPWEKENCDAILETWFPGTMGGPAIVETLFGESNPSGKLTMTFPVNVGQIPIYYNAKNTGRPFDDNDKYRSKYLDVSNKPLFPFGFGLSYTTFRYGDLTLSKNAISCDEAVIVSIPVTNTGNLAGDETVQLYIRDLAASITRPVKELRGFQKISLSPGETKTVSFKLTVEDLEFFDASLKHVAEPGDFDVMCGGSSEDVHSARLTLL